jgi:hypothetical protein
LVVEDFRSDRKKDKEMEGPKRGLKNPLDEAQVSPQNQE